jgi:uncharacterized protein (TIGR00297 family)
VDQPQLAWQSKLILLLVLPAIAANLVFETRWWILNTPVVAIWTLGASGLLGLLALQSRSATSGAALTGAVLTASLMFSTAAIPYRPSRTALIPVLAVLILTSIATRLGHRRKEQLGLAESRKGRKSSQVVANIGVAALVSCQAVEAWQWNQTWLQPARFVPSAIFIAALAALCEAAADTVSSELGQVLSGRPRMITTLRVAPPGTDGAISLAGTLAGIVAACIVAAVGALALSGGLFLFAVSWSGGVFGLFFDSILGATVERRGWLNNDIVNFLSTASAAAFALVLLTMLPHSGVG